MKLVEYTTSTYNVTLTTQSVDSTSSLSYGTESSYTFTSSESGSGTYWVSSLQDARSVSSSTASTTKITSSVKSVTASSATGISTTASTIESSRVYGGKTSWQDTYIDTWTRSMVSLQFSHTGITSIISVSSYGDYTYRSTTYSNKMRIDTTVTSTICRTIADKNSEVVSVSQTNSWLRTLGSYSTTTDVECIVSKGVASSLIYVETGSTIQAGNKYYNTSITSLTSLEAERTSGTLYNSTVTRIWTQSTDSQDIIPAESIKFTSLWFTTFTNWDEDEYTYISTSSTTTAVSTSSVSFMSATLFPNEYTYSILSSTHSYIHEWISYTTESTAGPLYLGSQTLSIVSQVSSAAFLSETYSRSWVDKTRSWSNSNSYGHTVNGITYVQSYSFDYNYAYTTTTWDWHGTDYVQTTTTARGSIRYETSAMDYTSVAFQYSTTFEATTYSSSSGSSSTWFSSTTYTGQFGVHSITTTLSNYSSIVSTSSAYKSQSSILSEDDWESPEDRYSKYYGSGSTTYAN